MTWIYKKKIWLQALHLKSEYSYIFLNFFLHSFHDLCVCVVVQIDDHTLRQSSPARLVKYRVWCIVRKDSICSCDLFCDVCLQASCSTQCRRVVRCLLVVSSTTITCLLCTLCKSLSFRCFFDVWSLWLEDLIRSFVNYFNRIFEKSLHVRNICRKNTQIAWQLLFAVDWKRYFDHLEFIIDWKLACISNESRWTNWSPCACCCQKWEFSSIDSQKFHAWSICCSHDLVNQSHCFFDLQFSICRCSQLVRSVFISKKISRCKQAFDAFQHSFAVWSREVWSRKCCDVIHWSDHSHHDVVCIKNVSIDHCVCDISVSVESWSGSDCVGVVVYHDQKTNKYIEIIVNYLSAVIFFMRFVRLLFHRSEALQSQVRTINRSFMESVFPLQSRIYIFMLRLLFIQAVRSKSFYLFFVPCTTITKNKYYKLIWNLSFNSKVNQTNTRKHVQTSIHAVKYAIFINVMKMKDKK